MRRQAAQKEKKKKGTFRLTGATGNNDDRHYCPLNDICHDCSGRRQMPKVPFAPNGFPPSGKREMAK